MHASVQKRRKSDETVTPSKMTKKSMKHSKVAAEPMKTKGLQGTNSVQGIFLTIFPEPLANLFFL